MRLRWFSRRQGASDRGYALAALLVAVSVMAVLLSVAVPNWGTVVQREREAELVFRGEQYARAIALYQRQFANTPPPNLEVLVEQGFLRRAYQDPMVPDGDFEPLLVGNIPASTLTVDDGGTGVVTGAVGGLGGIVGVTSRSTATSLRQYNGATRYNEWLFLASQFAQEAGIQGAPGQAGGLTGAAPTAPEARDTPAGIAPTAAGRGRLGQPVLQGLGGRSGP
jgi:type II secretory pathway pseudopilin PulG